MQEQWRKVAGWPDYSVSNLGRVRRDISAGPSPAGRILNGRVNSGGYYRVALYRNGTHQDFSVHRLVAIAFIGQVPADANQVAHFDGCPGNNHVENLRWATCKENHRDSVRHGTASRGAQNGRAKLSAGDVRAIKAEYAAGVGSQSQIGARYGVNQGTVSKIVRMDRWAHLPD
jgi:hypothetical protein